MHLDERRSTQILIKFHLHNLDLASTSKFQPNISTLQNLDQNLASEFRPRLNFITSTRHQQQNTDQTSASKSCLNFNFKIFTKPCIQSLNKVLGWPFHRSIKSFTNILFLVDIIKERLHVILFWYKLVGETLYSQILLGSK